MAKNNIVYFPGNRKVKQTYANPAAVTTNNDALVKKMNNFLDENNDSNFAEFVSSIYRSDVLLVVNFDDEKKPMPCIVKDPNGNIVQPVFTDVQSIPPMDKLPRQGVVKIPFMAVVKTMLSQKMQFSGVCVNFMKQGLTLTMPLLNVLVKFDEDIKSGKLPQDAQFDVSFLPKRPEMIPSDSINVVEGGKLVTKKKEDVDVQSTIEVKNPECIQALKKFNEEKNNENFNEFISILVNSRILIPARLTEDKKPMPLALKNDAGESVQPVFLQKEDIGNKIKGDVIMNTPFMAIVDLIMNNKGSVSGIYVNPFSEGILLKNELIEKIVQVEKNKAQNMINKLAEDPGISPVTTSIDGTEIEELETDSAYRLKQRILFDYDIFPTEYLADAKRIIEEICEGKENYIDEKFENAYEDVRRYPYLSEEFVVTAMNLDENSEFVFIQMPEQDKFANTARYIFLYYNKNDDTARYFVQATQSNGVCQIREITSSREVVTHQNVEDAGNAAINDVLALINKAD